MKARPQKTRKGAAGEDIAAEIRRLEQQLLRQRQQARAVAPEPGLVWRSDYEAFAAPLGLRHAANPASGSEICAGLKLFHDAGGGTFSWSQRLPAATPPALALTVYDFPGSFLSLVAEMPPEAAAAVGPGREFALHLEAGISRPMTVFLRLNLEGPDARETLHETRVLPEGGLSHRFDLGGLVPGPEGWHSAWLDLILHAPRMCRLEIRRLAIAIRAAGGGA